MHGATESAPPAHSPSAEPTAEPAAEPAAAPPQSAAEREYADAMRAARALGLDVPAPAQGSVDREIEAAGKLVAAMGLDQPVERPPEPSVSLLEPEPEEEEGTPEDDPLGPDQGDGRAWFVLNTYTGHESRVEKNLERRIESMDVGDRVFRVVVPTEEELEIRGGQRRLVQRKLLPGYVLVEMILDDQTWYVVRNTPGVTGFVGAERPNPLPREEVKKLLLQMRTAEPRLRVSFAVNENIRVMDGPFQDFIGKVEDINLDKGKVRVMISMFGRETPVELDFMQVEKV